MGASERFPETQLQPKHILVTGGAGFIGSNFVRWVLQHDSNVKVTNLDALTYAGNLRSLVDVEQSFGSDGDGRYRFVRGDVRDFELVGKLLGGENDKVTQFDRAQSPPRPIHHDSIGPPPDAIVHFAAESHVDRSIAGPEIFVETNVKGTLTLLEACRRELDERPREFRFIHLSTDEVYGDLGPHDPPFTESSPLAPNNPYSASKAAADHMVRSYRRTFGLPVIVTRCSNNYGPFQFPEKLIPLMITRALRDESLPVYGDGTNVRDWIHVDDHCRALWAVMECGEIGAIYNIAGGVEVPNIEIVKRLLALLDKPESLIEFVRDRPGHDRRYAMGVARIKEASGWAPRHAFADGLADTVQWYLENESWWQRIPDEA